MKKLIILLAVLLIAIQLFGWNGFGQSRGTNFTQRWMALTSYLTLGNDANNTSGMINWIASDGDTGTMAIGTSDNFAVTGFTGGFDVDGAFTAGTVTSDGVIAGTTGSFTDDIDSNGNYIIDSQSITDSGSKSPCYYFGGNASYIDFTDDNYFINDEFTIVFDVSFSQLTDGADEAILAKYYDDASVPWHIVMESTAPHTDKFGFGVNDTNGDPHGVHVVNCEIDKVYYVQCRYYSPSTDNYTIDIWVNGDSLASETWTTYPIATGTSDFVRASSSSAPLYGNLYGWKFYSVKLTSDDMKREYSSGTSETFKSKEMVTNGTFLTNTTGWDGDDCDLAAIELSSHTSMRATATGTTTVYIKQDIPTIIGAKYKISYDYYIPSTNTTAKRVIITFGSNTSQVTQTGTTTDAWASISELVTAAQTSTEIRGYFRTVGNSVTGITIGDIIYFDNISIVKVGADGDYRGENATPTVWYDASGNDINGTVTKGTIINSLEHGYANDYDIDNDLDVGGDLTVGGALTVTDTINSTGGLGCYSDAISMADASKFDFTAASIGWGHLVAGDNVANAYFTFAADGTVTLEDNLNCTTTEDNDTTFNIFDSGTGIGFNNELGSTVTVLIEVHYITP